MTIKNILNVAVVFCSISLSCFGDARDDVKNIVLSTSLTPKERAMQVAALIDKAGSEGADVAELTQIALQNATPEEAGFMMVAILFKNSSDANVAAAVSTVITAHPAQAAEILAQVVQVQDSGTASKVIATVAVVATSPAVAQAVMSRVETVVTNPEKMQALREAASDPGSVVSVPAAQRAAVEAAAETEAAQEGGAPEGDTPAADPAPVVVPPVSPESVPGYGRQTA